MWFSSKREILEYCGKDWKDVRWLDRAIKDGRVIKLEWDYCTVADYIKELEESESENLKIILWLKREIEELKNSGGKLVVSGEAKEAFSDAKFKMVQEENADLRRHLAYAWGRCDAKQLAIDSMVQSYFNKNSQSMDFEEAQEKLYGIIKYKPDPLEWEERQFAVDNQIMLA